MSGREDDRKVEHRDDDTELAIRGLDVGTSGRPLVPPPAPGPEATYQLAWRYGRDLARLHLVDPEKLFFMWEVSDETARRGAGRGGRLSVRLVRLGEKETTAHLAENVFAVSNWYFDVERSGRYRAEIGWLLPDGSFETWIASAGIETPRLVTNPTPVVHWRTRKRGRKAGLRGGEAELDADETLARGERSALLPEELPSERPRGAASAAGIRRREAGREIARQPWSGVVTSWSRTAIPPRKD